MEENEDEPDDVKKATPVADEIKSGSKDEKARNPKGKNKKKDDSKPSRCDKNGNATNKQLVKLDGDCCRSKLVKPSKAAKTMSVMIYSPPCTLPRLEIIPRHCLSKKEYVDVLATPSRKCPSPCLQGRTVIRKVRPITARMNELAQPARRLIVSTLQERGGMLPPEMISNLVKSIEGSTCMTPEQAEQYFRDKERSKERKNCKSARQKCKGKPKIPCPSTLDKEAVMCQYLMAERFVKSILQWKCPIPVDEFRDIANVILRRLSFTLEYTPLNEQEDLKSQQMRFLADIVACWISGVLFEVAEDHKKELEEEQLHAAEEEKAEDASDEEEEDKSKEAMKEPEEEEDEAEEEEKILEVKEKPGADNEVTDKGPVEPQDTGIQTEKEGDKPDNVAETPVKIKTEKPDSDDDLTKEEDERNRLEAEKKKQQEIEEKARKEAEEKARLEAEEKARKEAEEKARKEAEEKARKEAEKKEMEEAAEKMRQEEEKKKKQEEEEAKERKRKQEQEEEEKKRKEREEAEAEEKRRKEAEEKKKKEEEEEEKKKKEDEEKKKKEAESKKKKEEEQKLKEVGLSNAIKGIGDGELFKTDLPFVTYGKVLNAIYDMLEDEPEGDETDIVHNRIQRALYEKFTRIVDLENPDALTENLKDVIDVMSGKIASWLKRVLKDSELKFMNVHPPEVESKEIRDWGKWIDQVTDRAGDWADWIHRVVKEAETKSAKTVNRGDWQTWTSDTDTNALLWRRYYLETVHQAHHNKMMLMDRPVVKTGEKGAHLNATNVTEEEIKNTDLGD